jgi:N-acetylglucosaminyl-diphospho-decaprenol L-rhamnosyltransferase
MRIVILSYDLPEHTARAVRSSIRFARPEQVLLVHNGSSEKNRKNLQRQFNEIDHLVLEKNRHFSGGANAGLREAFKTSEWAFFLTNDCEMTQLSSPPNEAGIFAPKILYAKSRKIDSLGGQILPQSFRLQHLKDDFSFEKITFPYVPGTAFWIHRETFQKLGGFDESLQTYWEDVDLSMRASLQKIRMGLDRETELLHGVGKTCHSLPYYTSYLFQRNRKKIILRYADRKTLPLLYFATDNMKILGQSLWRRDWGKAQYSLKALLD